MQSFLISLSTVALAELGDRTQILALLLAAQFRKPWSVLGGVLCATLVCNALAAFIGVHLASYLTPRLLDTLVGISMIGMGLWALKPEPEGHGEPKRRRAGAFVTTLVAFCIAETGDKTQIAALALAAAYSSLLPVIAGATVGMLLANAPAVFLGHTFATRLPLRLINLAASVLFIALGGYFLWKGLHH